MTAVAALMTISDACTYLGGRSRRFIYELASREEIEVVYLSKRSPRVMRDSVDAYIQRLLSQPKPVVRRKKGK